MPGGIRELESRLNIQIKRASFDKLEVEDINVRYKSLQFVEFWAIDVLYGSARATARSCFAMVKVSSLLQSIKTQWIPSIKIKKYYQTNVFVNGELCSLICPLEQVLCTILQRPGVKDRLTMLNLT